MIRSAASAPHWGSALAAALMLAAALAYNAGARTGEAAASSDETLAEFQPPAQTPSADTEASVWPQARYRLVSSSPQAAHSSDADPAALRVQPAATQAVPLPVSAPRPRLAVIIDDVGLDLAVADRLMALDAPVTLSILPYADAAPQLAQQARARGLEVFLHLPMEPVGLEDPGPYALTGMLDDDAMAARLRWAFDRVPGAVGFNNHMGSRMTSDPSVMDRLFSAREWAPRMMFVDSVTHARSHAAEAAGQAGLIAHRRDVFLDHVTDEASVRTQMNRALALALQNGQAIAIGHPRPETLRVLSELAERADAVGVDLVPVQALDPAPSMQRQG